MLRILAPPQRLCDGRSRRDFILAGAIGSLGLALPRFLQAAESPLVAAKSFGRAKRCILLFLTGGPSQHDTWDPKPDAPVDVRGELKPIATNVAGIQIGELFPQLAKQANKYCLVRSVTHNDQVHTTAGYAMLTGIEYPRKVTSATQVRPSPNDHPHLGSLLAKFGPASKTPLPFVSLPETIKDAGVNEYPGQGAGFLGNRYAPFLVEADTVKSAFLPPSMTMPMDITLDRLHGRHTLLEQLNQSLSCMDRNRQLDELNSYEQQAFGLISSPEVGQAFDLQRESQHTRDAYGSHLFGRGCLLARRLLEAGVSLATVYWHYDNADDFVWDTHQKHFPHLRNQLAPPTDQAISALLVDLSDRGMLADTLVVVMGEFGRSPKINRLGGRDHWAACQSILMAGAGIRGGTICGASDRTGAGPASDPITPADLAATLLHLLGVPPQIELHDMNGRPVPACRGTAVEKLLA